MDTGGGWALGPEGIYFFTPGKQASSDLQPYEYATGYIKKILTTEGRVFSFTSAVSPDGRTILYTQRDEAGSDLMLVENFR